MRKYCYDSLDKVLLSEIQASIQPLRFWIHECTPKYWTFYFCIQYAPEYCLVFYADTELGAEWEEVVFLRCEKRNMTCIGSQYVPPRESFPNDAKLPAEWSALCNAPTPLCIKIIRDTVVFRKDYANGSTSEEWQISADVGVINSGNNQKWILMTADGSPRMIYFTEFFELEPIRDTWRFHYDLPENSSADDPYSITLASATRDFLPLRSCEIGFDSNA